MHVLTLTVPGGVAIVTPARRASDTAGLSLTGGALTVTIPALVEAAKDGAACLAACLGAHLSPKTNRTYAQPKLDGGTAWNEEGKSYIPGSNAEGAVVAMFNDGLRGKGPGGSAYSLRLNLTAEAVEALAYAASMTECLHLKVDGTKLVISAEVALPAAVDSEQAGRNKEIADRLEQLFDRHVGEGPVEMDDMEMFVLLKAITALQGHATSPFSVDEAILASFEKSA